MRIQDYPFADLMDLEPHGADTYVGAPAQYPWGPRLYGGQVVAQGLRAAAATVDPARSVHSLHAYFIRPGSHGEPIRFEVERLRDGRSFSTRQVMARQSSGAILNLSVSFQSPQDDADVTPSGIPDEVPPPDDPSLVDQGWGQLLERRTFGTDDGPSGYWIRLAADIGDDPVLQACALAFMSDAAPSRAARRLHPALVGDARDRDRFKGASLDHAVWFHRPVRADEWHWFATKAHGLFNARGVVTGDVYAEDGAHVATMAQQVLLRLVRSR